MTAENVTIDAESIEMFRDSAAAFLGAQDQRQRVRALEAEGGGFNRAVWQQMADMGWFSILVPEALDGLGLGLPEVAAIAEECGRQLLPEPLVDAGVHPLALLVALPASAVRDELLRQCATGQRVVGVDWQENAGELEVHQPLRTPCCSKSEIIFKLGYLLQAIRKSWFLIKTRINSSVISKQCYLRCESFREIITV